MKIIKSITNALTKAKEKVGVETFATVRRDTVRKAIERGEFEIIKCKYERSQPLSGWSDFLDFKWPESISKEKMIKEYDNGIFNPRCEVSPALIDINEKKCYEISISFHIQLVYSMYVPVDGKKSEAPEKKIFTSPMPKQKDETTEEFVARIKADAVDYASERLEYLSTEKDREKRLDCIEKMTGLAIDTISHGNMAVCRDCGKVEEIEPMNCPSCDCEDYIQVWHLKTGEYYITPERYMRRAKNVTIKER
ncbi:hypothetical protein [Peribacillus asahii]|uniref:hypothetical protein n=1 Tax=Peribacillus asahii TaxID=228899 RepID=UPI0038149E02